ncbi:hypothetical protein [Methylococcus sp. EFPC2]|uniref:hypothetical protein n=1 Tax=Methylococcus sp. EFPC2 TaxID=2812648 RepID=UPI001967E3E6|nr:hypothetical protein [Methylococcus sp. EFPC2]QSA97911.1 hypothetical protein JWZ97_03525 [Methylococcus sp. EFPC2]
MFKTYLLLVVSSLVLASAVSASSTELTEATELLKRMHADECRKQRLRGQLLVAHQSHDQTRMSTLAPQLDAISDKLKPLEDQLKSLKDRIKKIPADQTALDTVQLELGECN